MNLRDGYGELLALSGSLDRHVDLKLGRVALVGVEVTRFNDDLRALRRTICHRRED